VKTVIKWQLYEFFEKVEAAKVGREKDAFIESFGRRSKFII
jgi:hypothetical protein